jgi:Tol biopolymer transport system component
VDNSKEIARIVGDYQPRWSPDGKKLLIVANYQSAPTDFDHDEIFLVNPDGNETRVTFFKDNFERNSISLPVWSPDSRYVAFWLSTSMPNEMGSLAVLDNATSTVDLYCNEFAPFPFRFGSDITLGYAYDQVNSAPPIWSPDSQYLLVENYEQFTSSTYLFDLKSHTITKVTDDARPVSWLK